MQRWQLARAGKGQAVLLSGEPGIGKSRLIAALEERLGAEPHTRLRYFCSPYHVNSALHPVIKQLERAAGLRRERQHGHEARQARNPVAPGRLRYRRSMPLAGRAAVDRLELAAMRPCS